jgi:hypothetical protein
MEARMAQVSNRKRKLKRKEIEAWLADVLVPVEPNPRFLRRLKARLVTYRGKGLFSGWMIVVVFTTVILLAITALGLITRLILGWLALLGLIGRNRTEPVEPSTASA